MNRLLIACLLTGSLYAADPDWPCWRGPFGNGATTTEVELVDGWGEAGPPVAWVVDIPGRPGKPGKDRYAGSASPVIVDGKVYLYSLVVTDETYARLEKAGRLKDLTDKKNKDELRALLVTRHDAETGKLEWATPIPTMEKGWCSSGTPAIDRGLMFIHASPGGLICLDCETGEVRWTKGRISGPTGGYGKHGSVQARNGLLVADGCVLEGATGKVVRGQPKFVFGSNSASIGLVAGKPAVVLGGSITDLATGKSLYAGFEGGGTPVTDGGFVAGLGRCAVGGRSKFHSALRVWRLAGGTLEKTVDQPVLGEHHSPILQDGRAWVFARVHSHTKTRDPVKIEAIRKADELYLRGAACIDAKTGEILWNNKNFTASAYGMGFKVNDRVIAYTGKEGLFMLNADTGETLGKPSWGTQDTKPIYRISNLSSPVFWKGRVYARGGKTYFGGMALMCWDLRKKG